MDDAESLFGSPPPSPTRGRSPSPALALPSVSANIINFSSSSAQNVGTIALPGSHNFSELPVNPLALSLSYPTPHNGDALRPPAQTRDAFMTQVSSRSPLPTPAVAPSVLTQKKTAKKQRAKSQSVAPRPTPPPIHLPDPSHPPPPNLLRNQPGLLGTAGVVARVRPSHLGAAPNQGMTSSNPIFVEDEPQPSRFKQPFPSNVDVASLPPPSNQDIVSMLISQRDIFPLLESILKFIATTPPRAASETPSQSRSTSTAGSRSNTPSSESGAAKKRRKLRHVPAGADLWDVPFPFNDGEGPTAYRNEWEKDRGKALIAELIALIKDAATKAALKNHLEKRPTPTDAQLASLSKYYRVETLFYNNSSTPKPSEAVFADASNTNCSSFASYFDPSAPSLASSPAIPTFSNPPPNSTPFDQLITSLLVSSNQQLSLSSGSLDRSFDSSTPDAGLLKSWMDILHTFPMPAEGFTPDFKTEDLHIDPRQTFLNMPDSIQPSAPSPALSAFDFSLDFTQMFPEASAANANQDFYPGAFDDSMMDPTLLDLPAFSPFPNPIDTSNYTDSGTPSLAGSPIPSVSSYSFGPMTPTMTPTETGWNGDAGIGIFSPGEEERIPTPGAEPQPPVAGTSDPKGKKRDFGEITPWTDAEKEALSFLEVLSKSKLGSGSKGKGKAKAKPGEDREGMWRRAIWNQMLKKL
ncbi:hypothetical protein B0H14DRAFT_946953 [Mycena olivaceomarginata]|nr:hypothetical protein B0H14DRAFT_946953 [Mycena olivaceomarginata]